MKNNFLVMEKLRDSLKGLDEATKNAEADRAALLDRIDTLEIVVLRLQSRVDELETKLYYCRDDIQSLSDSLS